MADIAPGLNFRIGADVKGVNKAIKEAEKSLKGAVSTFSGIGNSLSLAISAPIAAFTGLSVKAAGEMESLRLALEKTMGGAGRSIEEATIELEQLRKAAEAPGLDFEQAVKGSIRLQGVGYQAEEARRIVAQLANALALTGGTADQLDGVTKQFTQMRAKGKLMQEDLSIILENMPNLAKVMQDTFGTANAEMLRGMGVSVEDFISKLTDGMEKMPRAQGGIANAIVNAQNSIKLAIASVGEEINKTFNVTGKLESFSKWVASLATWFKGLDDETRRLILGVGIFAAALGPAFKLMQGGVFIVGKLQVAFLAMQKAMALSLTESGIPGLIGWWKKLDIVMKASYIGAAIAIVLALGAAWLATSKDMSAAAQAQRQLQQTQKSAMDSVSAEIANINALAAVAKDEKRSKEERLTAMKKLIDISPSYQGALQGETINTTKLDKATAGLVASLIRAANARKATEDIAELDKQLRNLSETAQPTTLQEVFNVIKSGGNSTLMAANQANTYAKNITSAKEALEAQRAKLVEFLEANVAATDSVKTGTVETIKGTGATEKATTALDKYLENVRKNEEAQKKWNEARAAMGLSELPKLEQANVQPVSQGGTGPEVQGVDALKMAADNAAKFQASVSESMTRTQLIIKSLQGDINGFGDVYTEVMRKVVRDGNLAEMSVLSLGESMMKTSVSGSLSMKTLYQEVGTGFAQMATAMAESGSYMSAAILAAGGAIATAAANGTTTLKGFVKETLAAGAKVIKVWIQMAVARAALSALQNVPFPFNIAAAGLAGAAAAGLFSALIKKIGIPALADGGVLTGPQMVLAGEYPGARANPEIISPENKMRDVFSEVLASAGGGGGNFTVTTRLSGDDLLLVIERAKQRATRKR